MPLPIALLIHFNQHFNDYANLASQASYRGLLKTLRAHPALKFNINISGTLLDALKWLDPEPIKLIRAGLSDGQFEMLGSTYAQNVPYASDDWDNAEQIKLHRATLKDVFNVEPTMFWSPERCWRQSLVPIVVDGGYTDTFVEGAILRLAGATEPLTYSTRTGSSKLKIIMDDQVFKSKFSFAEWFGRNRQVMDYLRNLASSPRAHQYCVAYGEDAEARGYWEWKEGLVPNQTWANLDRLLTELEADPSLQLIRLSEAPAPTAELTPIPDAGASWMDLALTQPGLPHHESGFTNWLDYNARSPTLKHFRQTFDTIRSNLRLPTPRTDGAQRLCDAALHAYLAHQYEFGCIGVGGPNYRGWEEARTALAMMRAAREAEAPREFIAVEDCNGDGADEVILSDGKQLIISSAYGGRLLYWFDLITGRQFVGNQLPVLHLEYRGSEYSLPTPVPARWMPETDTAADMTLTDVDPPTRLGGYLPEWIWEGEPVPLKEAVAPDPQTPTRLPLSAQTRAFCDLVTLDDSGHEDPPSAWLESRLEQNGPTFIRYLSNQLTLEKSFRLAEGHVVVVSYHLHNQDTREHSIKLRVTNELTPDYDEVIRGGRDALSFIESKDAPGVLNTRTGNSITIQSSQPWQAQDLREDFYALNVGLVFNIIMRPLSDQKFEINLVREKTL